MKSQLRLFLRERDYTRGSSRLNLCVPFSQSATSLGIMATLCCSATKQQHEACRFGRAPPNQNDNGFRFAGKTYLVVSLAFPPAYTVETAYEISYVVPCDLSLFLDRHPSFNVPILPLSCEGSNNVEESLKLRAWMDDPRQTMARLACNNPGQNRHT